MIFSKCAVAAALTSVVSAASAADLTAPTYQITPATLAYNWTGLYAGLNAGYRTATLHFTTPVTNHTAHAERLLVGGQIGVNWQAAGSPWVFGLETDFEYNFGGDSSPPPATVNSVRAHLVPMGTARARVGYSVDRALWYVTGGLAWGGNEVTLRGPAIGGSITSSNVHTGWTIGGGLEWAFANAWSAKIEYLYMNLGNEYFFPGIISASGVGISYDIHTIKAGVNYLFGSQPVVARY
jgi:outer membrane immunogenic protein